MRVPPRVRRGVEAAVFLRLSSVGTRHRVQTLSSPSLSSSLQGQHYFFFVALFPSPFLGFPFPRSFFRRTCSSLKSWCSSL